MYRTSLSILILAIPTLAAAATVQPLTLGPVALGSGTAYRFNATSDALGQPDRLSLGGIAAGPQSGTLGAGSMTGAYRADLATGEVGVSATMAGAPQVDAVSVNAQFFDTIRIDTGVAGTRDIGYRVEVDGFLSLANSDPSYLGMAQFGASLSFADVTGLDNSFFINGVGTDPRFLVLSQNGAVVTATEDPFGRGTRLSVSPTIVSERRGNEVVQSTFEQGSVCAFSEPRDRCRSREDNTGETFAASFVLEGTFMAENGRSYALILNNSASVDAAGSGLVDFMATSTFSFTDTGGATIFSASGLLPGTVAAPAPSVVPLPASSLLLASALFGVVAMRRRPAS